MGKHWNDLSPEAREERSKTASDGQDKTNDLKWSSKLGEMKVYKQLYGNCEVPLSYNQSLFIWKKNQRMAKDTMKVERRQALEKIGFDWKGTNRDLNWSSMFEKLKAYKQLYGHCDVSSKENPTLCKCLSEISFDQNHKESYIHLTFRCMEKS